MENYFYQLWGIAFTTEFASKEDHSSGSRVRTVAQAVLVPVITSMWSCLLRIRFSQPKWVCLIKKATKKNCSHDARHNKVHWKSVPHLITSKKSRTSWFVRLFLPIHLLVKAHTLLEVQSTMPADPTYWATKYQWEALTDVKTSRIGKAFLLLLYCSWE